MSEQMKALTRKQLDAASQQVIDIVFVNMVAHLSDVFTAGEELLVMFEYLMDEDV